ncbi:MULTISPECIES: DotA/TraY family protein [Achromobacter]|uniref:DotA/TraY family protein n=1 Tax=Achromobacter TaxID=222 RepID=UPI00158315CF|nr:DotA/TraY family protein [Achromobacter dolens]
MNTKKWLGILFLDVLLPWRPAVKSVQLLVNTTKQSLSGLTEIKAMVDGLRADRQAPQAAEDRSFEEVFNDEMALRLVALRRHFLMRKRLALALGGLLLMLPGIGFLASADHGDLAGMGLAAMSAGASGVASFLWALSAQFRLWQLRTRRLSRADRGGFEDFRREERDWALQALSPEIGISRGMLQVLLAVPLLGALAFVGAAWAQGMSLGEISAAAKTTSDLSRQALIGIFGQVVNTPLATSASGGDTILARIFQIGNSALLSVSLVLGGYMAFKKVAAAAHDGTVFEQGRGLVHAPIRVIIAIASLAPTANGWSISQLLMLWAASIMGVGTANLATRAATDALASGQTMVAQPVMPSTVELARSLYQANLCMYSINLGLDQAKTEGGWVLPSSYVQPQDTLTGMIFRSNTYVCGGADVTSAQDTAPGVKKNSDSFWGPDIDVSDIKAAHLNGLKAMQSTLWQGASDFVAKIVVRTKNGDVQLPNAEATIQSAAQAYESVVTSQAATTNSQIAALSSQISSSLQSQGWWGLGGWYQTFAQANTKLNTAMAAKAHVFGESIVGDPGIKFLYDKVMVAYTAQSEQSGSSSGVSSLSASRSNETKGSEVEKIMSSVMAGPGQRAAVALTNRLLGSPDGLTTNPLIGMKNIGDDILGLATGAVAGYAGLKFAVAMANGGLLGSVGNLVIGIGKGVDAVINTVEPYLRILILGFMGAGIVLSIYLPMIPFVVWFGAAINWLVVVGEAIIAAPLWAMTHMSGEGDGMGHRSGHGYIFLLNMMVRPLLMVVGFFMAGVAIAAGGNLLNKTFGIAMVNAQFDSMTGMVSALGFVILYCSLCMNLVHRCFNLIVIVPDQVINWVGGHASPHLGTSPNDDAHRAVGALSAQLSPLMYGRHKGQFPSALKRNGLNGERK